MKININYSPQIKFEKKNCIIATILNTILLVYKNIVNKEQNNMNSTILLRISNM